MARLLPLFPLQLVVFPGSPTPLHIFEPRYREMVGEAEAHGSEFGIVRVVSRDGDNGITNTGCTVTVELVNRALEAYERLGEASPEIDRARHDLSFRLAEPIDDLDFRSLMLQSRSELERLKMFTDFVDGYISRRDYVALMKKKAPTNGSGHK